MSNAINKRILMARKGMTALTGNRNIDKEQAFRYIHRGKGCIY